MTARRLLPLAILLCPFMTGPALADPLGCQRTIAKESAKHVQSVRKVLQRCENRRVAGSFPASTQCSTEPTTAAVVAQAESRLRAQIARRCGGADATCGTPGDDALSAIGWDIGSCPNLENGACANAITSCDGIATCLVCLGRAAVRQAIGLYYDELVEAEFGTGSTVNRCQRSIGKETARFLAAKSKALQRCWDARLKGRHANQCPTPGDGKTAARIAKAELRKRTRICAACGGGDGVCGGGNDLTPSQIGFVSSCPDVTVPDGPACAQPIASATDIVDCVDCVTEFKVDCVDAAAVPALTAYPAECNSTTTTTTTSTTVTTSTTLPACPPPPILPLGTLTFTIAPGTTECGGPTLAPPPNPPFSGEVDLLNDSKRSDLGLGCLYTGDGANAIVPGARVADGGSSVLAVAGISGLAVTVTASDGSGPADCTKGAGPDSHCLNDGTTACDSDADCGGVAGACALDANCFFGTPLPLPLGPLSSCIMNVVQEDVCGSANLLTQQTSVSALLSSRLYVTLNAASPCPQCVGGTCTAGARVGLACSGGLGAANTTIECPPRPNQFLGRLDIALTSLSTGTSTLSDPAGNFCPGQITPGAFGGEAGTIIETGTPLLGGGSLFATTLAGTFCVPATGNSLFDGPAGLPGPGAVSVPGTIAINLLP